MSSACWTRRRSRNSANWIVSLFGDGGIGKTTIAYEAAVRCATNGAGGRRGGRNYVFCAASLVRRPRRDCDAAAERDEAESRGRQVWVHVAHTAAGGNCACGPHMTVQLLEITAENPSRDRADN